MQLILKDIRIIREDNVEERRKSLENPKGNMAAHIHVDSSQPDALEIRVGG